MSRSLARAAAVADRRVTGLSREVLAELVAELGPRWQARRDARLADRPRRRAVGAGARHRLVFIDETWASTNMARRYGRAPRGQRLRAGVPGPGDLHRRRSPRAVEALYSAKRRLLQVKSRARSLQVTKSVHRATSRAIAEAVAL